MRASPFPGQILVSSAMLIKIGNYCRKNTLVSGSLVILAGSVFANLGAYLFHLLMGRYLGPINYGILESLISIAYFLGIANSSLNLILVKFISQETSKEKISLFVRKISQKVGLWGLVALGLFLAAFPLLKNLVMVSSFSLFFGLGIFSYLSLFLVIFSAVLQGLMKFRRLSFYNIFSSWSKLFMALIFILLGLKVGGAIAAFVVATLLSVFLGYVLIKKNVCLNISGEISLRNSFVNIWPYTRAVFFSNLTLVSFFTVDIILARYFLSPIQAGYYASLAILGKIIFFASNPISQVMFPLVSEKQAKKENFHKILWQSFLIVLAISGIILVIYFIVPGLMISLLFGKNYLEASGFLGIFAIFITLYSLCSLLINFFLSISKTRIIIFMFPFVFLQIVLICFWHSSIGQIIRVDIITLSLLFITLLVYYLKNVCPSKTKT